MNECVIKSDMFLSETIYIVTKRSLEPNPSEPTCTCHFQLELILMYMYRYSATDIYTYTRGECHLLLTIHQINSYKLALFWKLVFWLATWKKFSFSCLRYNKNPWCTNIRNSDITWGIEIKDISQIRITHSYVFFSSSTIPRMSAEHNTSWTGVYCHSPVSMVKH